MFGPGAKPLTGGGQMGGASFWDRMMQRQQGGMRPPTQTGPRGAPMPMRTMAAPAGAAGLGVSGGAAGGAMPMGGLSAPGGRASPLAATQRPSPLGGMNLGAVMSDEQTKKKAYLSGLNDRFAAIGGDSIARGLTPSDDEEEERRKRMGLEMFQSGMRSLGGGR